MKNLRENIRLSFSKNRRPEKIEKPWKALPPQWTGKEDELIRILRQISKTRKYFFIDVPPKFQFKFSLAVKIIPKYVRFDPNLVHMRYRFVPKQLTEEDFWKRYFYCLRIIKKSNNVNKVEEELEAVYKQSKYAKQQHEFEVEIKVEMKVVTKKVILLTEWLKLVLDIEKKNREKEEREKKEKERKEMGDFSLGMGDEKSKEELPKKESETVTQPKKEVKIPTQPEITMLFTECIQLKKKISFLLTEILEPESLALMHQINAINILFQTMQGYYSIYGKIFSKINEDRNKLKLIQATTFSPKLLNSKLQPPSFTSESQRKKVIMKLPIRFRQKDWHLCYSTVEHGISIFTLMEKTKNRGETLCFIKTDKMEIIGFFQAVNWQRSRKYYGSGETFVFTFGGKKEGEEKKPDEFRSYFWSKKNILFCLSNLDVISIGGGIKGSAIYLDGDLQSGSTHACDTFSSEKLIDDDYFSIVTLEVWGFQKKEKKKGIFKYKKTKLTKEQKLENLVEKSEDNPSLLGVGNKQPGSPSSQL